MPGPEDVIHDAVERLEWDERKVEETPYKSWRQLTRRTALTGGAAGIGALVLQACGSSSKSGTATASGSGSSAASSIFGVSGGYKFTFVNHVTTNTFFVPTQYGIQDACKLLGCSFQWTGSQTSNVSEMVNAINTAVAAGVSGIATTLIDPTAFNAPVDKALAAGIPVVAYNADEPSNARLSYTGQDLYLAGQQMGMHIAKLVPSGQIGMFIATPGSANIQPRINGALATLKSFPAIKPDVVATGAAIPAELTAITSWASGHPSAKGMFAVDAGSTQGVAQTIQKQGLKGKVKGGGFDLLTPTIDLLHSGYIQFTIDQQPYLQGFLPTLQLYMYLASNKLSGIADVDTGLKFLDQTTVTPYVTSQSRYEGSSTSPGVTKTS